MSTNQIHIADNKKLNTAFAKLKHKMKITEVRQIHIIAFWVFLILFLAFLAFILPNF